MESDHVELRSWLWCPSVPFLKWAKLEIALANQDLLKTCFEVHWESNWDAKRPSQLIRIVWGFSLMCGCQWYPITSTLQLRFTREAYGTLVQHSDRLNTDCDWTSFRIAQGNLSDSPGLQVELTSSITPLLIFSVAHQCILTLQWYQIQKWEYHFSSAWFFANRLPTSLSNEIATTSNQSFQLNGSKVDFLKPWSIAVDTFSYTKHSKYCGLPQQ
jgi:hypothetical protein